MKNLKLILLWIIIVIINLLATQYISYYNSIVPKETGFLERLLTLEVLYAITWVLIISSYRIGNLLFPPLQIILVSGILGSIVYIVGSKYIYGYDINIDEYFALGISIVAGLISQFKLFG